MLSKTLVLLATAATSVLAAPAACPAPPSKGAAPTLPLSGAATELTNPPAGMKLLHIALGYGIQNYTCASAGATPVATGAIAVFYDALPLFPGQSSHSLTAAKFNDLTADVLAHGKIPFPLDNHNNRTDAAHPGASLTNPFLPHDAPLYVPGVEKPLAVLGHHFFTNKGVPAFVLDNGNINLLAKKDESVNAPASASKGPDGTGAVAWLKLSATPDATGPAKLVYRVVTAGGNSHGCAKGAGDDTTPYAAQYWFFG